MLASEFNSLLSSDLSCAGALSFQQTFMGWVTVSIAHFGIGMLVSAMVIFYGRPRYWLLIGLAGIIAKEIAFDIPNGNSAGIIILDSIWDIACYAVGYFVQIGLLISDEKPQGGA